MECAAPLVDDILPAVPIRQWVLSFPYALRFLFATRPAVMREVLGILYRVIAGHLVKKAGERDKLERLCRYVARPAVATRRLSLTAQGPVRYPLKTPYRDGTTHVLFEPVDCMAHLPVRHPSGHLRSCKSAVLPIGHRPAGGAGAQAPGEPHPLSWRPRPAQPRPRAGHAAPAWQARVPPPEKEPRPEAKRRGAMSWTRRLWRAGAGDCRHRGPRGDR